MGWQSGFVPTKNRFRAHGNSQYYLATELTHPSEVAYHLPGYRGPTLRYTCKPPGVTAAEQNGDASGSASSTAFRDVRAEHGFIIYNVGMSIFLNDLRGVDQPPMDQFRLRTRPTAHDCAWTAAGELEVVLGFSTGEILSYQPLRKDAPTVHYSRGSFESSSAVTDVRWAPGREGVFVAAYAHGALLIYNTSPPGAAAAASAAAKAAKADAHGAAKDEASGSARSERAGQAALGSTASSLASTDGPPTPSSASAAEGSTPAKWGALRRAASSERRGLSLWRGSTGSEDKGARQHAGPLACWHICQSVIHQVAFSHDGRYLALVSADGCLRVLEFEKEALLCAFKSFYAGLLCVAWSADDKYLLTGGEDDLVSVWSLHERKLLARAQGHTSWVTAVSFDPHAAAAPRAQRRLGLDDDDDDDGADGGADGARRADGSGARCRRLEFGSVGADAKLLLWQLDVDDDNDDDAEQLAGGSASAGAAPVAVSRTEAGRRLAIGGGGGATAPKNGGVLRLSRVGNTAASPPPREGQVIVHASAPTTPIPSPSSIRAKGGDGSGPLAASGPPSRRRETVETTPTPPGLVLKVVPLSAVPLLKPIGGVAAHAEPVTQLVFTRSAILTVCLGGHVRVWIPRIPPTMAPSGESGAQLLTFNAVTIQTSAQQTLSASSKPCYTDPELTAAVRNLRLSHG